MGDTFAPRCPAALPTAGQRPASILLRQSLTATPGRGRGRYGSAATVSTEEEHPSTIPDVTRPPRIFRPADIVRLAPIGNRAVHAPIRRVPPLLRLTTKATRYTIPGAYRTTTASPTGGRGSEMQITTGITAPSDRNYHAHWIQIEVKNGTRVRIGYWHHWFTLDCHRLWWAPAGTWSLTIGCLAIMRCPRTLDAGREP